MPLVAIAALDPDRVIGRAGTLPWHLPEDLKMFKALTTGHSVVMGRRTWDSLPRKPLPGRQNIVLSRHLEHPEVSVSRDIPSLIDSLGGITAAGGTAFVIGGAALYAALLPYCDELILSHVHDRHRGDVWFPPYEGLFVPVETVSEFPQFHVTRHRNLRPMVLPASNHQSRPLSLKEKYGDGPWPELPMIT